MTLRTKAYKLGIIIFIASMPFGVAFADHFIRVIMNV